MQHQLSKHNLIFIVEDNDMYSFMLEYTLSEEHHLRCLRFAKGEECIRNLPLDPDLIILDYVLPGIDGLETYRQIRNVKPEVPVLVLTGNFDSHAAQHFLEEGVYDYMLKEEDAMNRVKSTVDYVLDKKIKEVDEKEEKDGMNRIVRMILFFLVLAALCGSLFWLLTG
jgi:DNA-binding response OmpR family regulator